MRVKRRLVTAAVALLPVCVMPWIATVPAAADSTMAPFNECPAVGSDTSCEFLIVINADGTQTVLVDSSQPPIDSVTGGDNDVLVGVLNNSNSTVPNLHLTSSTDAFGFNDDGPCTQTPFPANMCTSGGTSSGTTTNSLDTTDPSGYGGPNNHFENISADSTSGTVVFDQGGVGSGATRWFALEGALTQSQIQPPNPAPLPGGGGGSGGGGLTGPSHITGRVINSNGTPLSGSVVQACVVGTHSGSECSALATTDSQGNYTIGNLPSGVQLIVVGWPPPGSTNLTLGFVDPVSSGSNAPDIVLTIVGTPPAGTVFSQAAGSQTGHPPVLNWDQPTAITIPLCPGGGQATLTATGIDVYSGQTISKTATLTETSVGSGIYTGVIPPLDPIHGVVQFHIEAPGCTVDFGGWDDPSGTVTTPSGVPIAGATVTLLQSGSAAGPFSPVPDGSAVMSPGNRTNPMASGGDGSFGWDVVAGFYEVTAAKSGCTAAQGGTTAVTGVLSIPPPITGLNLQLNCPQANVNRLSGPDRMTTAIAVSQASFSSPGSAGAVVLANAFAFPDALAGTPLAAAKNAPLLLTAGDALDPRVATEISRVLPAGGTVYLLGGTTAMTPAVEDALTAAGFKVVRYGGINRFATAAIIADQGLGDPGTVMEATGLNFPDALAAGAAAIKVGAAIVLTAGSTQAQETSDYLSAHPPRAKFALGGPAETADPSATPIGGPDRFATAVAVAGQFFTGPHAVGLANGFAFPDALSGGVMIGRMGGPLLLIPPSPPIPSVVTDYLVANGGGIGQTLAFGGTTALTDPVLSEAGIAIG